MGPNCAFLDVQNFNENEEATCIEIALLLQKDNIKRWILLPLLSIFTLFFFPIRMYWNRRMQADWLFKRATSLADATNIFIVGRGKLIIRKNF